MLSPKRSQIAAASDVFGVEEQGLWLPLLVGSVIYGQAATPIFTDLNGKLGAVESGSLQAKQLNAAMVLIDRIGPVAASTSGSEGAYDTQINRDGLIEYVFSVLYGPETMALAYNWFRQPRSFKARNLAVLR